MLRHYLKIALRALRRRLGTTLINVGGLTVGLTCCLLIALFIQHERSFDRFHPESEDVYRVIRTTQGEAKANTASGFAPALTEMSASIERAVRVYETRRPYLEVSGRHVATEAFMFADASFFDVFAGFEAVQGNLSAALQDPQSVVVSASEAERLFGTANPIGQTIGYDGRFDLTVTAVMDDVPSTSHLQFDYVAPFRLIGDLFGEDAMNDFTNYNYFTYVELASGTDAEALSSEVTDTAKRRIGISEDAPFQLVLQPLADIHFNTSLQFDVPTNRSPRYLWIFGAAGVFVLLIACVNFMNLATAQSMERSKEIGVRKSIGAVRSQLAGQFLGEALLLSLSAIVLATGLTHALLPLFNTFIGSEATLTSAPMQTAVLIVGLGLLAGVLAGSYPALSLSRVQPAAALAGERARGQGRARLRQGLVVLQFALSVLLVIATLTASRQLDYMQTKNLGFSGEQVVYADAPEAIIGDPYDAFREQALQNPDVLEIAQGQGLPGRTLTNRGYTWPGSDGETQGESFWTIVGGPGYLATFDMQLVAGRSFSRDREADVDDAYILNETAVRRLGWTPEEAVGQTFHAWDRDGGTVIGVVEDFHFQSFDQPIEPLVINWKPGWTWFVAARVAPGNVSEAVDHLEATWQTFAPGYAFDYTFVDRDFARLYASEQKMGQLFGFFATLAVLVACFGLFGLSAYTVQRRTKEVSIRKVLGASVSEIVALLSRDFAVLVLAACVLAAPIAYVLMNRWLDGFAYRVDVDVSTFAVAGGTALLVALVTVSYHAIRAARLDPATTLQSE